MHFRMLRRWIRGYEPYLLPLFRSSHTKKGLRQPERAHAICNNKPLCGTQERVFFQKFCMLDQSSHGARSFHKTRRNRPVYPSGCRAYTKPSFDIGSNVTHQTLTPVRVYFP